MYHQRYRAPHSVQSRPRVLTKAQATSTPLPMTTLITFDVDGTLIHSVGDDSNKLHKDAFKHAYQEVFGLDTNIDKIKHHGGTDPLILMRVPMEVHSIPKEDCMNKLEEMKNAMCTFYEANKSRAGAGLELLPGVRSLLERLKNTANVRTALVTGNLQPIGWAKMDALGIGELFTAPRLGGFGSDYCSGNTEEMWHDRAEMIRIAQKKCPEEIVKTFHVGDTPYDVLAAQAAGVVPVGVSTGIFSGEELKKAVPDTVLLKGLDGDDALRLFGLL